MLLSWTRKKLHIALLYSKRACCFDFLQFVILSITVTTTSNFVANSEFIHASITKLENSKLKLLTQKEFNQVSLPNITAQNLRGTGV